MEGATRRPRPLKEFLEAELRALNDIIVDLSERAAKAEGPEERQRYRRAIEMAKATAAPLTALISLAERVPEDRVKVILGAVSRLLDQLLQGRPVSEAEVRQAVKEAGGELSPESQALLRVFLMNEAAIIQGLRRNPFARAIIKDFRDEYGGQGP